MCFSLKHVRYEGRMRVDTNQMPESMFFWGLGIESKPEKSGVCRIKIPLSTSVGTQTRGSRKRLNQWAQEALDLFIGLLSYLSKLGS